MGQKLRSFLCIFWKDFGEAFQVEELALMIRATRGRSMDGWMDGWMDEEVLIIGMMVGWSGRVPKCLTSVELRCGPRLFR